MNAGPNDDTSPTSHVSACSSPIAKTMSPDDVEHARDQDDRPRRARDSDRVDLDDCPQPWMRERREHHDCADRDDGVHDARHDEDFEPARALDRFGQPDGHQCEQQQGHHREDDAGAGETSATDAAVEGDRGEHHAERRHGGAECLNRRERFAADEDREDHGQPSVRGNDPG